MDPEILPCGQGVPDGHADMIRALLHDLRGPVGAIMSLANSPVGQTDRGIQAIGKHAAWMACLVEAVLADGAHDDHDAVDVGAALERAVSLARDRGGPTIDLLPGPPVQVWARPVALGRALDCVLDNACRAAGPDGHVEVRVADSGTGQAVITIVDDGPGLGGVSSGTLLGLTTTRAMLAACGGTFDLSAGRGQGAEATIVLELAMEQRAAG